MQSNNSAVTVVKSWVHSQNSPDESCVLTVKNLPPNGDLQNYLSNTLDVEVCDDIEYSEDRTSATIKLLDSSGQC